MTYHRQLGADIETIGSAVKAAGKIAEDPFLPEIACQIFRLNKIATNQNAGAACSHTIVAPKDRDKGVGLSVVAGPMRAFVWARAHPIQAAAVGVLAILGIYSLGYAVGRRRRPQ
jgi:hypothetical protein